MATANRTVIFYVTENGKKLGGILMAHFPGSTCERFSRGRVRNEWAKKSRLIFIMASGAVVRTLAPLMEDKRKDPPVVVLDEKGRYAISLLGGHLGGANALAEEIASVVGGRAVITTASDVNGLPAIDLWAERQGLTVDDWSRVATIGARLVNRGELTFFSDVPLEAPWPFRKVDKHSDADIVVTNRLILVDNPLSASLTLRPRNLVAGIGCNSGTSAGEIEGAVKQAFQESGLSFLSLSAIATIDKKRDESGLVSFAKSHSLPLLTFTSDEINNVRGVAPSEAARKATGAQAVAEPVAVLGSGNHTLLMGKKKIGNVTVAVAERKKEPPKTLDPRSALPEGEKKGKIFVVGIGPGSADHLTPRAAKAIDEAEAIVGYGTYLDLIRDLIEGKEIVSTGMAREIDRCRRAIGLSAEGRTVAVISGGDPGIFGMAGLVLELLKKDAGLLLSLPEIEIVPGVSALNACAARLGAPLMHDFAVISLSDRLTPWPTIEARLETAAQGDFVIVLYNPKSKGRQDHIRKARDIIMAHRPPDTPVGIVRGAMRAGEIRILTDLLHMPFENIDMQTTVVVGNSRTMAWNGFIITPRGYEQKKTW
jgi:cobalt-precorrin 5A hydrolase/precorrin-3B C17-methyltransferase